VKSFANIQSFLGNMGRSGGGINALRGTSNVQGSTDMGLLANYLPGYLAVPRESDTNLDAYLARARPATITPKGLAADTSVNWWGNYKKYIVSLLKSWYGDSANKDNDFGFGFLPKTDPTVNNTHIGIFEAMGQRIQAFFFLRMRIECQDNACASYSAGCKNCTSEQMLVGKVDSVKNSYGNYRMVVYAGTQYSPHSLSWTGEPTAGSLDETFDALLNLENLTNVEKLMDMLVFCDKQ
jgi:hypothetical protein